MTRLTGLLAQDLRKYRLYTLNRTITGEPGCTIVIPMDFPIGSVNTRPSLAELFTIIISVNWK